MEERINEKINKDEVGLETHTHTQARNHVDSIGFVFRSKYTTAQARFDCISGCTSGQMGRAWLGYICRKKIMMTFKKKKSIKPKEKPNTSSMSDTSSMRIYVK
jgi:hypothetical protein